MWPAISSQKKCYYKYLSAIRLNGLLENQTIRFTQPGLFNDPFEMPAMIAAQEAHDLWTSIYLPKLIGQTTGDILEHAMRRPFEINPRLLDFPATVIAGTFRSESVSPGDDSLTSEQAHDLAWSRLTEGEKREVDDRRSIIDRVREIDQTFGILSLTESYDNLLMWAHYADEHRGAVVEIETSDPAFLEPDPDRQDPREVRYSLSRPRLSVDDQVLLDVFFTKSPQWEYEREYRIVRRLEHATRIEPKSPTDPPIYVFPCPNRCLRSIIFGQRFPQNRPELVAAVREHLNQTSTEHVALRQARVDRAEYRLLHEEITRDRVGKVGEDVVLPKL